MREISFHVPTNDDATTVASMNPPSPFVQKSPSFAENEKNAPPGAEGLMVVIPGSRRETDANLGNWVYFTVTVVRIQG
jgi:hypothetical protein